MSHGERFHCLLETGVTLGEQLLQLLPYIGRRGQEQLTAGFSHTGVSSKRSGDVFCCATPSAQLLRTTGACTLLTLGTLVGEGTEVLAQCFPHFSQTEITQILRLFKEKIISHYLTKVFGLLFFGGGGRALFVWFLGTFDFNTRNAIVLWKPGLKDLEDGKEPPYCMTFGT